MSQSLTNQLIIRGRHVDAEGGATFEVLDPSTGKVITRVANGTTSDALRAVDAAEAAAEEWAGKPPRERAEILRRAYELMTERSEELALLISRENGKALRDARGEVAYAAEFFRWYSEEAVRVLGTVQTAPSGANNIMVLHQPVGVCLLITPWNFPAAMATRKLAPALAAGCTMVLKPASETPLTALAVADILADAGVPDGVVGVVPSRASGEVAHALLHDPRVRKVSFTGSTEVGSNLLHEAADNVVNASMELGGNAPFMVFADADLNAALDGAMIAKMRNGGSACTAANRFYVEEPVAREFGERLAQRMAALKVGNGTHEDTEVGPLVNARTAQKVLDLIAGAKAEGATVLTGGTAGERETYVVPTVLSDVQPGAAILGEEIFGPVAPIVTFTTEDEAVELANDTRYGLVSYVYTRDLARGLRVSERIDSGMVALNRGLVSDPAAPFGGTKQSGVGREGGHEGVLDYTESKYIAVDWKAQS
ncbi:NAD-dependent succinate-semialdehyde dehydrogenase [Streptomyces sp. NPDC102360]|uniref:NAD-dependent succinate-semialdehyde dehydrogenase n=1 Tax=Streptomyces sp. NPDC102360 TaxID=3366160 RepID=UPI0037FBE32D